MNVSEYNNYEWRPKPWTRVRLKDGNGTRLTYYIDGQKESEGNYKSGNPDGGWRYYPRQRPVGLRGKDGGWPKGRSLEILQQSR
jgi:uncharacterized protein